MAPTKEKMGLLEKIQAKFEFYRLEQRYARRRNRNTFLTEAQYVNGEYVYNTNSATSSSGTLSKTSASASSRPTNQRQTTTQRTR